MRETSQTWNSQLHQDLLYGEQTAKEDLNSVKQGHTRSLDDYMNAFKKKFIIKIICGILAIVIVVFQIFFYSQFYRQENILIADIQSVILGEKPSAVLKVLAYLIQPHYIHLITLHIIFTILFGTDCILGIKLIVNNLLAFSINKIVLLFHQEPRPFWINPEGRSSAVDGYGCVSEYSSPDMSVQLLLITSVNFLLIDTQLTKLKNGLHIPPLVPYSLLTGSLLVYCCLYIGGQTYLSQFIVSMIYGYAYYLLLAWLNPTISVVIRKCTFEAHDNFKGNINYFMLFLIAVVGESLILMSSNKKNLSPKAIFNYVDSSH